MMRLQKGFTLLEVMIVVLIIGIGASAIRLMVTDSDPLENVQRDSQKFNGWFTQQIDIALIRNEVYGLYFTKNEVYVLEIEPPATPTNSSSSTNPAPPVPIQWAQSGDPYDLKQNEDDLKVELMLDLDSENWVDLESDFPEEAEELQPHILILPSEEYEPSFKLIFSLQGESDDTFQILGNGYNRLEMTRETL